MHLKRRTGKYRSICIPGKYTNTSFWLSHYFAASVCILLIVFLILPGNALAQESEESEFLWTVQTNGQATITGLVENSTATVLSLPSIIEGKTVTEIGNNAFANNTHIIKVEVPVSITVIGDSAFEACENLEEVQLHAGITSLGKAVFKNCSKLISITAPVLTTVPDPGDANNDGTTDIMDLVNIIDYIVKGTAPASLTGADANGDGSVDIMDLVYIIDLIVNPPVNSSILVNAVSQNTARTEVEVKVPFSSSSPITALEVSYTLSPGLAFISADCSGMTGKGGSSNAVFTSFSGVTSGIVTLRVKINAGVTTEQFVKVTAVTGANTVGTSSVGIAQAYPVSAEVPTPLAIVQQPVNTTVVVGSQGSFTVAASGAEPLSYQWYINRNDGSGWVVPANGTQNQYVSSPVTLDNNSYRYFCRITDASRETINSETVTLTVVTVPQTGDSSHPYWLLAATLLAAGGIGAVLLYRWYKSQKKEK